MERWSREKKYFSCRFVMRGEVKLSGYALWPAYECMRRRVECLFSSAMVRVCDMMKVTTIKRKTSRRSLVYEDVSDDV